MRYDCYNFCFYKIDIKRNNIYYIATKYVKKLSDFFSINPVGISYTGKNKIHKFTEKKMSLIKNEKNLKDIVVLFGGDPGVNNDWNIFLEIFNSTLSIIIDKKFTSDIKENLFDFISIIEIENNFDMGFVQFFPSKKIPEYFNHGTIGGNWSPLEEEKIWSWSMHYPNYEVGNLRDVYPYNIISDLHLNRDVHGQTLESWIKSDRRHGALEKLTQTHWLWTIEDEHIPDAQDVLSRANLLVAYWELGK